MTGLIPAVYRITQSLLVTTFLPTHFVIYRSFLLYGMNLRNCN